MSKKVLVAYFSATGTTRHTAEGLAAALHADLQEIAAEVPYTSADLDWNNKQSRSSVEMQDTASRPAFVKADLKAADYDEILIGFPIWWGIAPTIINSFIEDADLNGKAVRVFATSGGSGIDHCEKNIRKQYPQIDWKPGELLNSAADITKFTKTVQ